MTDKSYVTMETRRCLICGNEYSTGALLLDKRVRPIFEKTTCTGWGMCDEHAKAVQEGFVGLVEVDESKSESKGDKIMPDGAYRTGRVLLIKREALQRGLTFKLGDDTKVMFVSQAALAKMIDPDVLETAPMEPERSTHGTPAPGSDSIN